MTADVIVLAPKKLHPLIEIALTESGCSTIEQYAEKRGIDAAAKLAASSRMLSTSVKGWLPPWRENERDVCGIARYHWWIDTLSFFEQMTCIDYHELAHHWDEILDFVKQLESGSGVADLRVLHRKPQSQEGTGLDINATATTDLEQPSLLQTKARPDK